MSCWDISDESAPDYEAGAPTIGKFENLNLEILDLPSLRGRKVRIRQAGEHMSIYIYIHRQIGKPRVSCGNTKVCCTTSTPHLQCPNTSNGTADGVDWIAFYRGFLHQRVEWAEVSWLSYKSFRG